jgi:hypothetical protein
VHDRNAGFDHGWYRAVCKFEQPVKFLVFLGLLTTPLEQVEIPFDEGYIRRLVKVCGVSLLPLLLFGLQLP